MLVDDAMANTVSCVRPEDDLGTAAILMRAEGTGFLPVVDHDKVVGVITDRDIVLRAIGDGLGDPRDLRAAEVMSTDPITVEAGTSIETAALLMEKAQVRRLPVIDHDGHVLGVLSHGNLVQATSGGTPAMSATIGVTRGA